MKENRFLIMGNIRILLLTLLASMTVACNGFLNVVPDNVVTIDHAFSNQVEAEKYLFVCYSYLPGSGEPSGNIGMTAGDEMWLNIPTHVQAPAWYYIAKGDRTADKSQPDFWKGSDYTYNMMLAIRECNTFLENVENLSKVPDLSIDKRVRWIAEVKFLKAFYHYYLFRMYGPVPIIDKNLPVSASPEEVQVKRNTVDECVNYIVGLLDESYADLPLEIYNRRSELGRITKPINRALKAKVLLLAASPLFNGNPDFANFQDKDGKNLFPAEESQEKWALAADAALDAIEVAESAGHELYYFDENDSRFPLSETSKTQLSVRMAVCDRWNDEVIWGLSSGRGVAGNILQQGCQPILVNSNFNANYTRGCVGPTMAVVNDFYSKNGVPINEDKTMDFTNVQELRVATDDEKYNFQVGYTSARINFDREDRFYASIGFDGGKWLMSYDNRNSDWDTYVVQAKRGQTAYGTVVGNTSITGYFAKKLVNWDSDFRDNSSGVYAYAWPEIRLAELYLTYAEALNEAEGPVDDVFYYLDKVRDRAGLDGVKKSWDNFSTNSSKYTTKEGMREIIHQERRIELALEGHRYWDILRWKEASKYFNTQIQGWDITQEESDAYYQVKTIYTRSFVAPRDYFNPIPNSDIIRNGNLVQNPGW